MNRFLFMILMCMMAKPLMAQIMYDGQGNYYDFLEQVQQKLNAEELDAKQLKKLWRQDDFYRSRLFPSGNLADYQKELKSALATLRTKKQNSRSVLPEWKPLGNTQMRTLATREIYGNGRISFIKFHPQDWNTIYVGAPTGCVWISTNNGEDWEIFSDQLPCRGYNDMAFAGADGNTLYLLTGDYNGKHTPFYGIYKSVDHGVSWEWLEGPDIRFVEKIMTHPTQKDWVYLVTQEGLYYSIDGGKEWQQPIGVSDFSYDLEFHLLYDSILYLMEEDSLKISHDHGLSFDFLYDFSALEGGRSKLSVHPLNPSDLYVNLSFPITGQGGGPSIGGYPSRGIFHSQDEGQSFEKIPGSDELYTTNSLYNMVFEVYPQQERRFANGWVWLYINDPDEAEWRNIHWGGNNVHVDQHAIAFDPKNPDCVLSGNDGGLYRSCDFGESWENISGNLNLMMIHGMGHSNTCEDWMLVGTQDNGSSIFRDGEWQRFSGGDGFACGFDAASNDIAYWSMQRQAARRSDRFFEYLDSINAPDAVNTYTALSRPFHSFWFRTSFVIHPDIPGLLLYTTQEGLYRSTDYGENWEKAAGDNVTRALTFSDANPDIAAFAETDFQGTTVQDTISVQYSLDRGVSWNVSRLSHPAIDTIGSLTIPSGITIDSKNPQRIWVLINKLDHHHVFYTPDGGQSWEEISKGLPNVAYNDILYQPSASNSLYLATDLGIYYLDDHLTEWMPYNEGLPLTLFSQLSVSKVTGKLRAASYGSGMWETDLYEIPQHPPVCNFICNTQTICQGEELEWEHTTTFAPDSIRWIFEGGTPQRSTADRPKVVYHQPGTFDVSLIAMNDYGRDTLIRTASVEVVPAEVAITTTEVNDSTYLLEASSNLAFFLWSTGDSSQQVLVTTPGWHWVEAYDSLSSCRVRDSVYIDLLTSLSDLETAADFCQVYPNPNNGRFLLQCPNTNVYTYRLYSLTGQLMQLGKVETSTIDLTASKGWFMIEFYDREERLLERKKVVVLR